MYIWQAFNFKDAAATIMPLPMVLDLWRETSMVHPTHKLLYVYENAIVHRLYIIYVHSRLTK